MKLYQKILAYAVLPLVIILLAWLCVGSIMQPVNFNKQKDAREQVAIQRLKDVRALQVAFKSSTGHYAPTVDSLIWFYNNGKLEVLMQLGTRDDSLSVANTEKYTKLIKAKNPKIKPNDLNKLLLEKYNQGEKVIVTIKTEIPVRDTICHRADFVVDSIKFIPFSLGDTLIMESTIKTVSGVKVPLFEASMPYNSLLKGMNRQLIVNLNSEREDTDRYPGLKVGSVTAPNNNAGNWE